MKTMKVDIATDTGLGTLTYENASGVHTLSFGLGYNAFGQFPDYDLNMPLLQLSAWKHTTG